jgi:uncharacterized protein (DUF1330 family)
VAARSAHADSQSTGRGQLPILQIGRLMTSHAPQTPYLDVTQESGRRYFSQARPGPVVMLNLLRFRAVADYSASPALAPSAPITGAEAYERYMAHSGPYLARAGSEILFLGEGGEYLIGPPDERWDLVLLVRHRGAASLHSFAANEGYLEGLGHRLAALEDSRLLPIIQGDG